MKIFRKILREVLPFYFKRFDNSKTYWERRYYFGGNSGQGSYGEEAKQKANFLNYIVKKYDFDTVLELGSGDGNNISFYELERYIGFDISKEAIKICRKKFKFRDNYSFYHLNNDYYLYLNRIKSKLINKKLLVISFDVIFHLVEDEFFIQYFEYLDAAANDYILIYSTDYDCNVSSHVKHRQYSKHLIKMGWGEVKQERLKDSFSDRSKQFKLFKRKETK